MKQVKVSITPNFAPDDRFELLIPAEFEERVRLITGKFSALIRTYSNELTKSGNTLIVSFSPVVEEPPKPPSLPLKTEDMAEMPNQHPIDDRLDGINWC